MEKCVNICDFNARRIGEIETCIQPQAFPTLHYLVMHQFHPFCVDPHANTSTPSIRVSTPFASPLAPSNLSPNVLKELKAPMCLCAIFSSYKSIQFFNKKIGTKCVSFAKP